MSKSNTEYLAEPLGAEYLNMFTKDELIEIIANILNYTMHTSIETTESNEENSDLDCEFERSEYGNIIAMKLRVRKTLMGKPFIVKVTPFMIISKQYEDQTALNEATHAWRSALKKILGQKYIDDCKKFIEQKKQRAIDMYDAEINELTKK